MTKLAHIQLDYFDNLTPELINSVFQLQAPLLSGEYHFRKKRQGHLHGQIFREFQKLSNKEKDEFFNELLSYTVLKEKNGELNDNVVNESLKTFTEKSKYSKLLLKIEGEFSELGTKDKIDLVQLSLIKTEGIFKMLESSLKENSARTEVMALYYLNQAIEVGKKILEKAREQVRHGTFRLVNIVLYTLLTIAAVISGRNPVETLSTWVSFVVVFQPEIFTGDVDSRLYGITVSG